MLPLSCTKGKYAAAQNSSEIDLPAGKPGSVYSETAHLIA